MHVPPRRVKMAVFVHQLAQDNSHAYVCQATTDLLVPKPMMHVLLIRVSTVALAYVTTLALIYAIVLKDILAPIASHVLARAIRIRARTACVPISATFNSRVCAFKATRVQHARMSRTFVMYRLVRMAARVHRAHQVSTPANVHPDTSDIIVRLR